MKKKKRKAARTHMLGFYDRKTGNEVVVVPKVSHGKGCSFLGPLQELVDDRTFFVRSNRKLPS